MMQTLCVAKGYNHSVLVDNENDIWELRNLTSKETKQRNRKVTGTPDQASLGTRSRQKNKLKVADNSKAPDNKKQTLT